MEIVHNTVLKFIVKDAAIEQPSASDNGGWAIAFEAGVGFHWCNYANGSKTWRSAITGDKNLEITTWLKKDDSALEERIKIIDAICSHHPSLGVKKEWSHYTGGMKDDGDWYIRKMLDATEEELTLFLNSLK